MHETASHTWASGPAPKPRSPERPRRGGRAARRAAGAVPEEGLEVRARSEGAEGKVLSDGQALDEAVPEFLRERGQGKPHGVPINVISYHLGWEPVHDVCIALRRLSEEGKTYDAIDRYHFQCLTS